MILCIYVPLGWLSSTQLYTISIWNYALVFYVCTQAHADQQQRSRVSRKFMLLDETVINRYQKLMTKRRDTCATWDKSTQDYWFTVSSYFKTISKYFLVLFKHLMHVCTRQAYVVVWINNQKSCKNTIACSNMSIIKRILKMASHWTYYYSYKVWRALIICNFKV